MPTATVTPVVVRYRLMRYFATVTAADVVVTEHWYDVVHSVIEHDETETGAPKLVDSFGVEDVVGELAGPVDEEDAEAALQWHGFHAVGPWSEAAGTLTAEVDWIDPTP